MVALNVNVSNAQNTVSQIQDTSTTGQVKRKYSGLIHWAKCKFLFKSPQYIFAVFKQPKWDFHDKGKRLVNVNLEPL